MSTNSSHETYATATSNATASPIATATSNATAEMNATATNNATASSTETNPEENEDTSSPNFESHMDEALAPELLLLRDCTDEGFRLATRVNTGDFETPLSRGEIPDVSLLEEEEITTALRDANMRKRSMTIEKLRLIDEVSKREERVLQRQIDKLNHRLTGHDNIIDIRDEAEPQSEAPQVAPILPTLPAIPIGQPQQIPHFVGIDTRQILTLSGKITPAEADYFYQQSKQANFKMEWQQIIQEDTIELMRLRIKTSYNLLKITEEEASEWDPTLLSTRQMSDLVYTLYGNAKRTETQVQVFRAINEFNFGFDINDRAVEEDSHTNLMRLIKDHYGAVANIEQDVVNKIVAMIYRKLPAHSELEKLYKDKTASHITLHGKDTIVKALDRFLSAIQAVREILDKAKAFQVMGTRWFSGSTADRANQKSSSNETISYGKKAAAILPVMPKMDKDFAERNRRLQNRCETCGHTNHIRSNCRLFGNVMVNNTNSMWHFSRVGLLWKAGGHDNFKADTFIEGLGFSKWSSNYAPKEYVYPPEDNPDNREICTTDQLKNTAKQFRNQHNNNNGYQGRNTYKGNNDNKRPRSENIQYVSAIMRSIQPKLLPVRLYLNLKGRTTTGIEVTTATTAGIETGAEASLREDTPTVRIPGKRPTTAPIPGTPGRDSVPANTANPKKVTTTTDPVAPTPPGKVLMVRTEALLDSGSLAGNFINVNTLTQLKGTHQLRAADETILVCSGLDNNCLESNVMLDITLEFDANDRTYKIDIPVRISNDSPLGCILGIDTIKKHNIVQTIPHFFLSEEAIIQLRKRLGLEANKKQKLNDINSEDPLQDKPTDASRTHKCTTNCNECTSVGEEILPDIVEPVRVNTTQAIIAPKPKIVRNVRFDETPLERSEEVIILPTTESAPAQTPRLVAALIREVEQLTEDPDFGDEGIDHDRKDTFAPFRSEPKGESNTLDKITICGTPEQQERIRALCVKYKQIFKDELDATPAKIKPFDLKVDKTKWETYKNRGPVRQQSTVKNEEIRKQVTEMINTGIIEKSPASFYSQVMLTPKPNGTWRFCVDYRALNDATDSASWPIPNIANLLGRLGRAKADIFGVMDLTSGYHQAPITLACRIFTAFITFAGVYQFTRLPFGPKRAPSYFQEEMATCVLAGLIYIICEMYLDDCIVYANGTDEFCKRLEQLFIRFDEKHIFLKAIKCKLGMSEVEYVGKTISKDGLRMSDKQIQGVNDFPKPVNNTQLRSFLGFINYFRDHVPNHSNVVSPLTRMVDHSASKKTAIKWTPEGTLAFDTVKQLISVSPKLYFIHDTAPIVLMTDASDYGIGGYLHQTVDNVQQLVALVSKALTVTQLKWTVIQKEAYAIFYCCTQLDRLLRDRKFTIETDHKNLMFLKTDSNAMVIRWWMAIQELDFDIKFIAGTTNGIADALSRLCSNQKENAPKYTVSAIMSKTQMTTEHYKAIASCHNSMVGHSGLERTIKKLKSMKFNWLNMRTDVWTFIQQCPCCQKMSHIKVPINAIRYTTSTYRSMECLNIDFQGPFPDKGYLLVVICTFSRYVCIYPVPDATAKSALSGLLKHFGTYGSPKSIRSDNGSHFVNEVIKQFLEMVGTTHDRTMAYSSEENAIVERSNKEINRYIKAFMFDRATHENYQEVIPFVTRILNTNVNERTKVAPAQILFGNSINLDRGILIPFDETSLTNETMTTSSSRMLQQQKDLMCIARDNLLLADSSHNANIADNITEFAIDSYVLALPRTQPKTRLHPQWSGPYRVLEHNAGKYKVKNLITNKDRMYHVTQLKQFQYDPTKTDPTDIARRDNLEFFVEKIISYKGDLNKVSTLTFYVKWLGYDDTHNTFEPWKELKDNIKLHEFLKQTNLSRIIPRKFLISTNNSTENTTETENDPEN